MTHYRCLILGKKEDITWNYNVLLEKYDENLEVPEYVADTKQELIEIAKERKTYFSSLKDTDKFNEYMEKYVNANTDEELYQCIYSAYDKYNENGDRLSTYNPNSKYDYYSEMEEGKVNNLIDAYNLHGEPFSYAILTDDGVWHAPGTVGWFGSTTASEKEEDNFFQNEYGKILEKYKDGYYILIDCHI